MIDTLHLTIPGDYSGLARAYYSDIENATARERNNGIVKSGYLLRGGAAGYCVSVWKLDFRVYFADSDKMGVWIQIGPIWLNRWKDKFENGGLSLYDAVNIELIKLGIVGFLPDIVRLKRLDYCVDIEMDIRKELLVEKVVNGWVGRSRKVGGFIRFKGDKLSGVETIEIGSEKSCVRLKMYDKVVQSKKIGYFDFWCDVWNIKEHEKEDLQVVRIEYQTQPYDMKWVVSCNGVDRAIGKFKVFASPIYFKEIVSSMLEYLMYKWGRLAVPEEGKRRDRWEISQLWSKMRELVLLTVLKSRRAKEISIGISDKYLNQVVGQLSGMLARVRLKKPLYSYSINMLMEYFYISGITENKIFQDVSDKHQRMALLCGV